jgi:hypothetical protein
MHHQGRSTFTATIVFSSHSNAAIARVLVVSAMYAIRAHYADILGSNDAQEPVKILATTLLEDFDRRYNPPADNEGKIKFIRRPETGLLNRYLLIVWC